MISFVIYRLGYGYPNLLKSSCLRVQSLQSVDLQDLSDTFGTWLDACIDDGVGSELLEPGDTFALCTGKLLLVHTLVF